MHSGTARFAAIAMMLDALVVARGAHAEVSLSLEQALAIATRNNHDLRAARARLEQSATMIDQAWAALLPQVTAQGKYTHNYKGVSFDLNELNQGVLDFADVLRSSSGDPAQQAAIQQFERRLATAPNGTAVLQKREQLNANLTVVMPLFVPYAYLALKSAKQAHFADHAQYLVFEATLLFAVAQTYYAAAGADELRVARQAAEVAARQTLQNARIRFEAGSAREVDVARARVACVRAEQASLEASDAQALAYRSLKTLLAISEPVHISPSGKEIAEPPSEAALIEYALANRPEFMRLRWSQLAAHASANSAKLRWAPSASAFGNAQAFNYAGFSGDRYSWAVGVTLDWTLYDGGLRDAQRRQFEAQERETAARLELLRDTLRDDVANARRALETQRHAVASALEASQLSRETLRLVRVQYESGRSTQLDLLHAQDALVNDEVALVRARFAAALAELELYRQAGTFPIRR